MGTSMESLFDDARKEIVRWRTHDKGLAEEQVGFLLELLHRDVLLTLPCSSEVEKRDTPAGLHHLFYHHVSNILGWKERVPEGSELGISPLLYSLLRQIFPTIQHANHEEQIHTIDSRDGATHGHGRRSRQLHGARAPSRCRLRAAPITRRRRSHRSTDADQISSNGIADRRLVDLRRSAEFYMSSAYFSPEEAHALLSFQRGDGLTLEQALQAAVARKVQSARDGSASSFQLCTSHDLAPVLQDHFAMKKVAKEHRKNQRKHHSVHEGTDSTGPSS